MLHRSPETSRYTSWHAVLRPALVAIMLAATLTGVHTLAAPPAAAGPDDNFTLVKTNDVEGEALIGEEITFTLTATGDQVSAETLYNLSFRDVLPAGVNFVSASPAPSEVLTDIPSPGETTVIWSNAADLPPLSSTSVSLTVDTNPDFAGGFTGATTIPVGSVITNTAQAVGSLSAFTIPDYDLATGAFTGDFDGTGAAANNVSVIPFRLTKTANDELLRGVHALGFDGETGTTGQLYTIVVENNPDYAVHGVNIVDTLDAGLEFLGCDTYYPVDNSSAEEWPGSGPAATGAGCGGTPTSVDTTAAGETEVTWTIGDLAPGATVTVTYQAGIPLFENAPFAGAAPTAASLNQGRNLDNNTGASTGEPDATPGADPELLDAPEPRYNNNVVGQGTYTPTSATEQVSDGHTVESEDLRIEKTMTGSLVQGSIVNNTLTIETSEYRDFTNLVVRDLLPSSLCFLGGYNVDNTPGGSDWDTTDCANAGSIQSTINGVAVNAAAVRELPDGGSYGTGRLEVVWDFSDPSNAALASLGADETLTITYSSVVRQFYRGNGNQLTDEPVLSGDTATNNVEVRGPDVVADASLPADTADPDGGSDGDTDHATIFNGGPSMNKRIAQKVGPVATNAGATASTCADSHGAITWVEGDPSPELGYGPGDIVCFELGASFGPDVQYEGVVIQDLLPQGLSYVAGSATRILGIDTLDDTTLTATPAVLTFAVGDNGSIPPTGNEFRWVFAAEITDAAESDANDIAANLMKLVYNNNAGEVFQLRDQAAAEWTEPEVRLAKGVDHVGAAASNGADFDGSLAGGSTSVEVIADDEVTFRVDVWNIGNGDAENTEVQDHLPTGFSCADVSTISDGGTCTAGVITWTGLSVDASTGGGDTTPDDEDSAPITLDYVLGIPSDVDPSQQWTNTAGVASYEGHTNTGDSFDYYPEDNIDSTNSALENTDAADDPAYLNSPNAEAEKLQRSGIDEAGNRANGSLSRTSEQATIGEIVQYQMTATIPEGTTVFDARLRDPLPAGLTWHTGDGLFAGSVSDLQPTVTGTAGLTGGTVTFNSGTVTYNLPSVWTNAAGSGPDTVSVTFYAQVIDVPGNVADPSATRFRNRARFDWDDADGNARPDEVSSAADTFVVEPNPEILKTHTDPVGASALPGQDVTYQVTVSNPTTATNVSVAHDITIVDTVPVGLTPTGVGGVPVSANGDPVPSTGVAPAGAFEGTWSETDRTITWTPADWAPLVALDPDASASFTYLASVDDPAVAAAALTNTAELTAYSLAQDLSPANDPNSDDARSYTSEDDDTIDVPIALIDKDIEPFNDLDPNDDIDTLTVGQPVDYQVSVTIPDGTVAYDATLFDTLESNLDFDELVSLTVSSECEEFDAATSMSTGDSVLAADVERFHPTGGNNQLASWFLGDVYANGSCEIVATYTAHVNNTAVATDTPSNEAQLKWNATNQIPGQTLTELPTDFDQPDSSSWTTGTDPVAEDFEVIEPALTIDKDVATAAGATLANPTCDTTPANNTSGSNDADGSAANGCDTTAGTTLRYTVTVASTGSSAAHDITVVDTVPVGLTPLATPGGTAVVTTGDTVTGAGGAIGLWHQTARTITWTVAGPLAPTTRATLDYDAVLAASDDLTRGEELTNTADIPTYYGVPAAERADIVADNPANDDLVTYGNDAAATRGAVTVDEVTIEVHFPDLEITKTATAGQDSNDVRLDQPFSWTLTVTNTDAVAPAFDIDISDALPEGWTYDALSAQVTTPHNAGPVNVEPTCTADVGSCGDAAALNRETLEWSNVVNGDAEPLGPLETITVVFTATPESAALTSSQAVGEAHTGYDGGSGFEHVNNASVSGIDDTGSASCCDPDGAGPLDADDYTDTDDDTVYIARADLEVDKTISPLDDDADTDNGPYWFGSFVNYTITLDNGGPDDATNVTISDVLDPAELAFDAVVSVDQGAFDSATNLWTLGTVADGATLQLTIRVRLVGLGLVTNVAQAATSDQYDSDSTPGNDDGSEDDQDSVSITVAPTSLGDYIWLDLNGDGIQDGSEPGIPGVEVTLSWLDPGDGSPRTYTTTTNAVGSYGVPPAAGLPANTDITVTVNPANSPNLAGLTPTFDRDGLASPHESTDRITPADTTLPNGAVADLDFDYGYGPDGTQRIGDTIWWDQNNSADATSGAGEPGLPDIEVTATWAGFDGIFGTADDRDFVDTTDGSGNYLIEFIPPGEYRVAVTASDLPDGLVATTYDLDGVGTPHIAEFTLDPSEHQLDVDFSYRGVGSIGDTIWYDIDGDGVINADEPGLDGVTVTLTWDGGDGIAGTTDDVTLTTTTDVNGNYLFEHLPTGNYDIDVDPATLPAGFAPTFDADGTGTAHHSTTQLTDVTLDDVDQDFGYRGSGSVGDTIFFDRDGTEADGALDAFDVPIPNVDVTITWSNPLSGADITIEATTDASGNYLAAFLPYGDYTVSVDASTLPAGVTPTFDDDGVGTPLTSATSIDAAAPSDLDQDFSVTGTASLGDTVWHDADGDGLQDVGETPLAGVSVTISYVDPVTGLTLTATAVTDADGHYLFEHLPQGEHVVTIDTATLPVGFVPTSDLDGTATPHAATVTLDQGANRTDVDFGYRPVTDLAIDKSHAGDFVIGDDNVWTINVTNNGPAPALAPVTITDVLPEHATFNSAIGDEWECSHADQTVTCTYVDPATGDPAPMAVGATSQLELDVAVATAAAPRIVNTATVETPTVDTNPENDTDTDPASAPLSVLNIDKSIDGELMVGELATYVLRITNHGPSDTRGEITVRDILPAALGFHSWSSTDAATTCSHSSQVVVCTTQTRLAVNETVTVRVITGVTASAGDSIVNTATVSGGNEVNGEQLPPETIERIHDELDDPDRSLQDDLAMVVTSDEPDITDQQRRGPLAYTGTGTHGLLMIALPMLVIGLMVDRRQRRRSR